MKGEITMSQREIDRLEVVQQVAGRQLSQAQAATRVGVSVRQIKRLVRAYRRDGAAGLVSQRCGQASNRRVAAAEQEHFVARVRRYYPDFGPTLAAEHLAAEHGFTYSAETLRAWMTVAGLWRPRRGRTARPHPPRPRRPCRGELVQIDGSPHDWFEGRGPRCTLIAFIDDATGEVLAARFVALESTRAYMGLLGEYAAREGRPVALYSDRHAIFTKHDPEDLEPTQFQRALNQLDIASIQATTPQAKGRVERLFQTLQDRLVKALRLEGIADVDAANAFLGPYLEQHNQRFAVAPQQANDAHRLWTGSPEQLARICALQYSRKLSKNLVARFAGQRYIVQTRAGAPRYALRGRTITVCQHLDARVELLNGDEVLPWRVFDAQRETTAERLADDKTLNDYIEQQIQRLNQAPASPSPDHPWRQPTLPHKQTSAKPDPVT